MYRLSWRLSGFHRSAMKMYEPVKPATVSTKVLWDLNVTLFSSGVPRQGLPSLVHGPQMFSATADRASVGHQLLQLEESR